MYTNLRIGDMSNLGLNQTEAKSWFIITNGSYTSIKNRQVQYRMIGGGSFRHSGWILDSFECISSGILELLAMVNGMTNLTRW